MPPDLLYDKTIPEREHNWIESMAFTPMEEYQTAPPGKRRDAAPPKAAQLEASPGKEVWEDTSRSRQRTCP